MWMVGLSLGSCHFKQRAPFVNEGFSAILKANEERRLSVFLERGELIKARSRQRGLDGAMELLDDGGRQVAHTDRMNGPDGPELLLAQAKHSGFFELKVATSTGEGELEFIVETAGPGSEQDRLLVHAAEATEALGSGPTSLSAAKAALKALPENVDPLERARLRAELGLHYREEGRSIEAAHWLGTALPDLERYSNDCEVGWLLNRYNGQLLRLGRLQQAEKRIEQAYEIWSRLGIGAGLGVVWNDRGILYAAKGQLERAVGAYVQALEFTANEEARATITRNLAFLQISMGQDDEAVRALNAQVERLQCGGESDDVRIGLAETLSALAFAEARQARYLDLSSRLKKQQSAQSHLDLAIKNAFDDPGTLARLYEHRAALGLKFHGEQGAVRALDDLEKSRGQLAPDPRDGACLLYTSPSPRD